MNGYSFTISLRVWHTSMDPAKITEALGKEAQRAVQARRPRTSSKGGPRPGTYQETY